MIQAGDRITTKAVSASSALLLLLGLVAVSGGPASAAPTASHPAGDPAFVPGEVVVGFTPEAGRRAITASVSSVEGDGSAPVPGVERTRVIALADGVGVEAAARRLERRDDVLWAEPNYLLQPQDVPYHPGAGLFPNDPRFGFLWGLSNAGQNSQLNSGGPPVFGKPGVDIGATSAWLKTTGSGRNIAVVDTGIDGAHPDLKANFNRKLSRNFVAAPSLGPDLVVDPKSWTDRHGHGTHVAGTIGAVGNNGLGVTGANWRTRLVALRVCGLDGCESADIAGGFAYAEKKGIPVVNASLGTDGDEAPEEIRVMKEAIKGSPRTLFVVAAGNESEDNDRAPSYPCNYPLSNILCVAAIDSRAKMPSFSNYGRKSVDLAAPGQDIESTWVNRADPFEEDYADGIEGFDQQPYPWKLGEVDEEPRLAFDGHDGGVPSPVAEARATLRQPINLEGLRFCRLEYEMDLELHGSQTFAVEYRSDGGPAQVAPPTLFTAADNTPPDETADLLADLGGADGSAEVELSFVFRANGTPIPLPSVQLGFMYVRCHAPMPPGGVYNSISGTSMASPHVAGVAGLVKSVAPKAGPVKLKKIIMRSVVPTKSLKGKTVTGGRVDAGRAVRFIHPAARPRLDQLRVAPKKLKLRARGTARIRVKVRNGGGATAKRLRVCLKAPRRLVRNSGCTSARRLGSGRTTSFRIRIRVRARARPGRNLRLKVVARVRSAANRRAGVRLKVKRP